MRSFSTPDYPNGQDIEGMALPVIEDQADVGALQETAHNVVMPHMNV